MSNHTENTVPNAWLIVMRRELLAKILTKSFLISLGVTVGMLVALFGAMAVIEGMGEDHTIAVSAEHKAVVEQIAAEQKTKSDGKVTVTAMVVADQAEAESKIRDGSVDVWLAKSGDTWTLTTLDSPNSEVFKAASESLKTQALAQNSVELGVTAEQLLKGSVVEQAQLEGSAEAAGFGSFVAYVMAMVFYLASILFGTQVAQSVIEEKQSRVVEIIATSIPLQHLLAGKVSANVVAALLQIVVFGAVAAVGISFTEAAAFLPTVSAGMLWFVAYFIVGFGAISCLWAAMGALASRVEDLQNTTMPMTMGMMGIFFGALLIPEGFAQQVASFIPPLTAVLMPMRVVTGQTMWWEPVVGLLGLVAFAAVALWFGVRLYRKALLQTGGRVSIKDAWAAEG